MEKTSEERPRQRSKKSRRRRGPGIERPRFEMRISTKFAPSKPSDGKPPAEGETPAEPDKDPYEGIAPEDLPPDLQYDADASVSFPTNT